MYGTLPQCTPPTYPTVAIASQRRVAVARRRERGVGDARQRERQEQNEKR